MFIAFAGGNNNIQPARGGIMPGEIIPKDVQEQFEQEIAAPKLSTPKEITKTVPKVTDKEIPESFYKHYIDVKGFNIIGNTVYEEKELEAFYSKYINNKASLAEITEAAKNIANFYNKDGYILANAYVPLQEIKEGIVEINIIEGEINKVIIDGNACSNNKIKEFIEKINNIKPFNIKKFEKYILLLNDFPGLVAKSVISKSKKDIAGLFNITLTISEGKNELNFAADNNISKSLGPYAVNSSYTNYKTRYSMENSFNFATSINVHSLKMGTITSKHVLNTEGTNLIAEYNRVYLNPSYLNLKQYGVKIESEAASLTLLHPLLRTRLTNVYFYTAFNTYDSKSSYCGLVGYKDKIRVIHLGTTLDYTDYLRGVNLLSIDYAQGIDVLKPTKPGGKVPISREDGNPKFKKFALRLSRLQYLTENLSLYLSGIGQHSHNILLASESFIYGGKIFGRGYEMSTLTGDSGHSFTAEVRYKLPSNIIIEDNELFTFMDYGKAHNNSPLRTERNLKAISRGIGLRFKSKQHLTGKVIIAQPLSMKVLNLNKVTPYKKKKIYRFLFGLNFNI